MKDYYSRFEQGKYYHLYNRGNNGCNLFYTSNNYKYFLSKYSSYLSGFVDTLAYCLLPNHFHLLIKVKEDPELEDEDVSGLITERFRRLFITYSQAVNKQENRSGSLFQKHYKRIEIGYDSYISGVILYIHLNPVKHKIFADFESYPYSSFKSILSNKPSKISRKEVLNWFGGKQGYIDFHKNNAEEYALEEFDK